MQCCRLIISIFHQVMRLDTNSWSLPFSSSPPKLSPKPVLLLFSILNIHLQLFKTTSLFVPLCIILTLLYIPSTDFTLFRWINYFSKNSFFRPSHQNECLVVSKSRWWGGKVANEGKGVCSPNYIAICVKHGIKEVKQYEVKTNTVRPFFAQFFAPASEGVSAAVSLFVNWTNHFQIARRQCCLFSTASSSRLLPYLPPLYHSHPLVGVSCCVQMGVGWGWGVVADEGRGVCSPNYEGFSIWVFLQKDVSSFPSLHLLALVEIRLWMG